MVEARNRRLGIDPAEEEVAADVAVLTEIRDLLAERRGGPTSGTTAL
jgi:large conductance mechanosensitive channel